MHFIFSTVNDIKTCHMNCLLKKDYIQYLRNNASRLATMCVQYTHLYIYMYIYILIHGNTLPIPSVSNNGDTVIVHSSSKTLGWWNINWRLYNTKSIFWEITMYTNRNTPKTLQQNQNHAYKLNNVYNGFKIVWSFTGHCGYFVFHDDVIKQIFSALLAFFVRNSPIPGEFPSQRLVTRSFGVFFDLCLNKPLSKQSGL